MPETRKKVLDNAIEAISSYILTRHLQVGEALPREIHLSEKLKISRNILREAMRHFRTLGIIQSRPRTGAVIARLLPEDPYAGYLPFISGNAVPMRQIAEMRFCFEPGAAPLMTACVTPEDLAELRKILAAMKHPASKKESYRLDLEFHACLLRIPRNDLIACQIPLLIHFFTNYREKQIADDAEPPQNDFYEVHKKIYDALEARDSDMLTALLREHNRPYILPPS